MKQAKPVIETTRLSLRLFTEHDAPFVLELLNSPGWLRFIGDRGIRSIEDASVYIESRITSCYDTFGFGMYLVELTNQKKAIGMCGLLKREVLDNVDIGFAFLPEYNGKGYALEAAAAVIDYARETLHLENIVAITDSDNIASQNLLRKLNMNFIRMVKPFEEEPMLMLFGN